MMQEIKAIQKEYLTRAEAALLLSVKPNTLTLWKKKGIIRPSTEVNGRIRFHISEINRLLNPNQESK